MGNNNYSLLLCIVSPLEFGLHPRWRSNSLIINIFPDIAYYYNEDVMMTMGLLSRKFRITLKSNSLCKSGGHSIP